jgi:hypothetical protein
MLISFVNGNPREDCHVWRSVVEGFFPIGMEEKIPFGE